MIVLHTECSGGWAGQERRVLLESEQMAARGHRLVLACEVGAPLVKYARLRGLIVHEVRYRRQFDAFAIAKLRSLINRDRPDIINTHSSKDAWVAGLAAWGTGIPVVRTRHLSIKVKPNLMNEILYTKLTRRIVTTGEALRTQLIEENGFPPHRIVSVPTGVDLRRFDSLCSVSGSLRKEYQIPDGAPMIGVVAMLRMMKGHSVLVDAAPIIVQRFPDARFILVGEAPEGSDIQSILESKARTYQLNGQLVFTGYRDDVPQILSELDCVVLPSIRDEGVPQSVTQALALARPVVATSVGATSEVVRNEETGLLVPPGDARALATAVIRLLADRESACRWAQAGQNLIRSEYSAERMAERMESVYRDTLKEAI